jgi:hypothetical protein
MTFVDCIGLVAQVGNGARDPANAVIPTTRQRAALQLGTQ